MDERNLRMKRLHRRQAFFTLLFFFGLFGGGFAWFISSPHRVIAAQSVVAEIKSVGDVKAIVAKYQVALDKIAVRGQQIDDATRSMGIDPTKVDPNDDPGFSKEMREMMGADGGPTTAERDAAFRERFKSVEETGEITVPE